MESGNGILCWTGRVTEADIDPRGGPGSVRAISPPTRQDLDIIQTTSRKLTGRRFLIVEDEPVVALLQAHILTNEGAEIAASVASVKEARDAIERMHVDTPIIPRSTSSRQAVYAGRVDRRCIAANDEKFGICSTKDDVIAGPTSKAVELDWHAPGVFTTVRRTRFQKLTSAALLAMCADPPSAKSPDASSVAPNPRII
jgi:hypothetical protein